MAIVKNGDMKNVDPDKTDQIKIRVVDIEVNQENGKLSAIKVPLGLAGDVIKIEFDGITNFHFDKSIQLLILNRKDDFSAKEFGVMLFADVIDSQGHPTTMLIEYGSRGQGTGRVFNYADLDK